MWNDMVDRMHVLASELRGMPGFSPALGHVQARLDGLAPLRDELPKVQDEVRQHAERSRALTAKAQLSAAQWNDGTPAALRAFSDEVARDVDGLVARMAGLHGRLQDERAQIGDAAGALTSAAMEARVRLKALEGAEAAQEARARELRDRATWTWIFPLAKAIDEMVSAIQSGRSTEAQLEETRRQIDATRADASRHIRAADLGTSLVDLLKQLAVNVQGLANRLSMLSGFLRSEESLARLATQETARVYLNAVMQLLHVIATEAA